MIERPKLAGAVGTKHALLLTWEDGRVDAVAWTALGSKLRGASYRQRRLLRLVGGGEGVHWLTIDVDLSARGLRRLMDRTTGWGVLRMDQ